MRVDAWYDSAGAPVAVSRTVEPPLLEGALDALVAGPTAAERAAGITSWFSAATRDAVVAVRSDSAGRVVVDLQGLPARIPGASSSAGSAALLASLDSTVFQFPWVASVEYRLDGSCEAFWNWLQRECRVVVRGEGKD